MDKHNSIGKTVNSFALYMCVRLCVREREREGEKSSNKNYHFHSNLHYTQGFHICYFIYSHLLSYLLYWV